MNRLSSPVDEAVAEVATDETRQGFLDRLATELGEAVVGTHLVTGDDVWARISTDAWRQAGLVVRDALDCDFFDFLSVIDWLPSPFGRGEDDPTAPPPERTTEVRQGVTGGDTRMQVFARVYSIRARAGITLKVDVPDDTLTVDSWVSVYAGANWHEREAWEMFGVVFTGHPQLTKLYLPGDFEGHPLRKDFPLLSRMVKPWPGIVDVEPMPGEPEEITASGEAPAESPSGEGAES